MIYFLYGDNSEESRRAVNKKASALAAELIKKKPDASLFTLTTENWNEAAIDEYTGSQGLFERKYIVLMKGILSAGDEGRNSGNKDHAKHTERKELFLEKIDLFAASPNIFIMAESGIDKASLKKIEKKAEKVQEIKGSVVGSVTGGAYVAERTTDGRNARDLKIFDLADALGDRDKKKLWILYRHAIDAGKVPEEIHGIFFWQVKSMILASRSTSAALAGLKPFVYSKSKRYAERFTSAELAHILERLVSIYHDAHRSLHDFETDLEIFILQDI
jgi:DNA polymerase III delta subunit